MFDGWIREEEECTSKLTNNNTEEIDVVEYEPPKFTIPKKIKGTVFEQLYQVEPTTNLLNIGDYDLTADDLKCLAPGEFISGKVLDALLFVLCQSSENGWKRGLSVKSDNVGSVFGDKKETDETFKEMTDVFSVSDKFFVLFIFFM